MKTFFNINYEFDKSVIEKTISDYITTDKAGYICVADGVILNNVNKDKNYREIVNGSIFSICDSSYVPLYIKWIYGEKYSQYSGSQIFMDIISAKKYKMFFMGTSNVILKGLKATLSKIDNRINNMTFLELPFCEVDEFDYPQIAKTIEKDGAEIIWIALGAPKQEIFMSKLKPYLHHGVMIAVGAVFKFYSGVEAKRAPLWIVKMHLEFVYRIFIEPKKQLRRCFGIISSLPKLLYQENKKKRQLNLK